MDEESRDEAAPVSIEDIEDIEEIEDIEDIEDITDRGNGIPVETIVRVGVVPGVDPDAVETGISNEFEADIISRLIIYCY